MYDMPFTPSLEDINKMETNMRTKPKRSSHFAEWDVLTYIQKEKIINWLNTPTKQRVKQAFRILIKLEDQYATQLALGITQTTTCRYLKEARNHFKMILSEEPFENICSMCAAELRGKLSANYKFKLHNASCERCKKHTALIPVGDYGLSDRGQKLTEVKETHNG